MAQSDYYLDYDELSPTRKRFFRRYREYREELALEDDVPVASPRPEFGLDEFIDALGEAKLDWRDRDREQARTQRAAKESYERHLARVQAEPKFKPTNLLITLAVGALFCFFIGMKMPALVVGGIGIVLFMQQYREFERRRDAWKERHGGENDGTASE